MGGQGAKSVVRSGTAGMQSLDCLDSRPRGFLGILIDCRSRGWMCGIMVGGVLATKDFGCALALRNQPFHPSSQLIDLFLVRSLSTARG